MKLLLLITVNDRGGGGTDLSQWLHTLGSSGLRGAAAEMKLKMRSPRRASLDAIVLRPPPFRKQGDTNQLVKATQIQSGGVVGTQTLQVLLTVLM